MGEIIHLAKSGRFVVKVSEGALPKPGQLLLDGAGKRVGKVVELMGPVRAPYASVIPMTDKPGRLPGTKVYDGGFAQARKGRTDSRPPSRTR